MEELKVTKVEDITGGEVIELPPLYNGKPFIARLRRPSLLTLCYAGKIPNELLAEAQIIYEGKGVTEGKIAEYAQVLNIVAEAALIEPKYSDIKDYLSDLHIRAIFQYCQFGVKALSPFCKIQELSEGVDSGKKNEQGSKPGSKH